ncbi:MAG: ribonuclease III [Oscillospiraceae bacterium]|jgi:ribonuclease-3 family protein|nr:ribonuclease III [Oscillospiraceae bacterium]
MNESFSSPVLAFTGDAVYSLFVREALSREASRPSKALHLLAVKDVCAAAQARAYQALLPLLTDEEEQVLRRGRNSHCGTPPKGASRVEYQEATGVECLFGWLWLTGNAQRARDLFAAVQKPNL